LRHGAHQEALAVVVWADIVELANVRVIQRGDSARFPLEALAELSLRNLQRNDAVQPRVAGTTQMSIPPSPIEARIS